MTPAAADKALRAAINAKILKLTLQLIPRPAIGARSTATSGFGSGFCGGRSN